MYALDRHSQVSVLLWQYCTYLSSYNIAANYIIFYEFRPVLLVQKLCTEGILVNTTTYLVYAIALVTVLSLQRQQYIPTIDVSDIDIK